MQKKFQRVGARGFKSELMEDTLIERTSGSKQAHE
jgi:hypothetical protein